MYMMQRTSCDHWRTQSVARDVSAAVCRICRLDSLVSGASSTLSASAADKTHTTKRSSHLHSPVRPIGNTE